MKPTDDEKTMGMLAHLLGIFSGFIGPLIIFITTKEKKGFVSENSRHALNFQISMVIYFVACFMLMFVLIGFILIFPLMLFGFIVEIIGSVRAYEGKVYKYPLEIPFIGG